MIESLKSKPRLEPLAIRFKRDERRLIVRAARRAKTTLSDLVRRGALELAGKLNAEQAR